MAAIFLLTVIIISTTSIYAENITYSVIASFSEPDMSVHVIVDNSTFPLRSVDSDILFKGQAPAAKSSYRYVINKNDNRKNISESFLRNPVKKDTENEFFDRPTNKHVLSPLPQIYPPLPEINRIKTDLHIEGRIATIHLWGNQTEVDHMHNNQLSGLKIKLNMDYISATHVQKLENVKVELAGRSSRNTTKLSYTLKLKKKGQDDLYGFKKFKLRAMDFDPSYLREHTAFSVTKASGLPTTGFSYVRLFINKKPIGLFGLIETFQDPWLAYEFANGDTEYKSGQLYQGIFTDFGKGITLISNLDYYGENLTDYNMGQYKIKAGKHKHKDKGYVALKDFTKFVSQATSETSMDEWDKRLNVEGFIRSMAIEDLLGFSDAYMTTSDNFYLYSDPEKNGRMIFIPSDLDTVLGSTLFDIRLLLSGNYSVHPGFNFQPLTAKFFSNQKLLDKYKHTILKLTKELLNTNIIMSRIDSVVNMIRRDAEWDKTLPRVGKHMVDDSSAKSMNDTERLNQKKLESLVPPGFKREAMYMDHPSTLDEAVNGPINNTNIESVKGFLKKKTDAVLFFYDQECNNTHR